MDCCILTEPNLSEVDEHLLARRSVKHMVVDAPVFFACIDLTGFFQVVHVVPECLFIARQTFQIAVFDELFFKDIVDGRNAEIVPAVIFQDRNDSLFEGRNIEGFVF